MKKFISLLLMILITSATVLSVSATEGETIKYDSIVIPESVRAELGVDDRDQVIVKYNTSLMWAFKDYSNIDEILSSDRILELVYRITPADGGPVIQLAKRNGEYVQLFTLPPRDDPYEDPRAISAFQTSEVLELLPEDTQIKNAYYLDSTPHQEGTALYYVTNHGDFIYHFYHFYHPFGRLFTLSEFIDYQKAEYDEDVNANNKATNPTNDEKRGSTNIYLWVGIPCIAVLAIAGVVFCVTRMRKDKKSEMGCSTKRIYKILIAVFLAIAVCFGVLFASLAIPEITNKRILADLTHDFSDIVAQHCQEKIVETKSVYGKLNSGSSGSAFFGAVLVKKGAVQDMYALRTELESKFEVVGVMDQKGQKVASGCLQYRSLTYDTPVTDGQYITIYFYTPTRPDTNSPDPDRSTFNTEP